MIPPPDPVRKALGPIRRVRQPTDPVIDDQHRDGAEEQDHGQPKREQERGLEAGPTDSYDLGQAEARQQLGVAEEVDQGRANT